MIQRTGRVWSWVFIQHEINKKGKLLTSQKIETEAENKSLCIMYSFAKNAKNSIYIVIVLTLNISNTILWEQC